MTDQHADPATGTIHKGLAEGKVGTLSGAMLGISCVAPGYTLTASIGVIVAAVGLKMPAIFIAGFRKAASANSTTLCCDWARRPPNSGYGCTSKNTRGPGRRSAPAWPDCTKSCPDSVRAVRSPAAGRS